MAGSIISGRTQRPHTASRRFSTGCCRTGQVHTSWQGPAAGRSAHHSFHAPLCPAVSRPQPACQHNQRRILSVAFGSVQVNVVYKFGGSSVRDAERMREVADIICSFPQYLPCVVLSAMGKVRGASHEGSGACRRRPAQLQRANRCNTSQGRPSTDPRPKQWRWQLTFPDHLQYDPM